MLVRPGSLTLHIFFQADSEHYTQKVHYLFVRLVFSQLGTLEQLICTRKEAEPLWD